jgi:hypothetical protein
MDRALLLLMKELGADIAFYTSGHLIYLVVTGEAVRFDGGGWWIPFWT